MKPIHKIILTAVLSTSLVSCSGPTGETGSDKIQSETLPKATEITWEDLMPEGEDELLETLYV